MPRIRVVDTLLIMSLYSSALGSLWLLEYAMASITVFERYAFLSAAIDIVAEHMVGVAIWRRWWSPLDKRLSIEIFESTDDALVGATLAGIIRGYDLDERGALTCLLVELDLPFTTARTAGTAIHWLVTKPSPGMRRTSRLVFSWTVARVVEAASFADSMDTTPIATARLRLCTIDLRKHHHP